MICESCEKTVEQKSDKLPRGWHRDPRDNPLCEKCWKSRYVLRAITIPVAGPVDATWDDFGQAVRAAWRATTRLANHAVELMRQAEPEPVGDKCPKNPRPYIYPSVKDHYPDLGSQSVTSVLQAVAGKYSATRYKSYWSHDSSYASFRYPTPTPIHNAGWSATFEPPSDGADPIPCVSFRLGKGEHGRRFTVRLRAGHSFRRQLALFRQIVNGESKRGELAIIRMKANNNDNRSGGVTEKKSAYRIGIKMVGYFPRKPSGDRKGVLRVCTTPDRFWSATWDGCSEPWFVNADHVRRLACEHERKRQRFSEDMKHEKRSPAKRRKRMVGGVADAHNEKYARRIDSFCHETTAHLVKLACRLRVERVEYDDTCRSYVKSFPWAKLKTLLQQKLDAERIDFSSGPVATEGPESLEIVTTEEGN